MSFHITAHTKGSVFVLAPLVRVFRDYQSWEVVVNMEGLDFVTLYLALTPSQAEAVLNGLGAMPQESSQRFGLRTNKMAAVQRSQYFHEWEARYGSGENPGLTHKDFV